MKFMRMQPFVLRIVIVAISLCFAVGTMSASYHACDMELPAKQEAQADMAGMDCASMDMSAPSKPKAEKQCCVDFSCPKCFSSPLTTARLETVAAPVEHAALVHGDVRSVVSHLNDGIDRPPKFA